MDATLTGFPRATCASPRLVEYIAARGGALTVTRQAILRG